MTHFISSLLLIISFTLLSGCNGKSASMTVYSGKQTDFQKFINSKNLPGEDKVNLSLDKSIVNNDYPFEIALYQDNKFFYDLPNLGTGTGTWKYSDGKIELKAKRPIFSMFIEIYGADPDIKKAVIEFRDRFGFNQLLMENHNI